MRRRHYGRRRVHRRERRWPRCTVAKATTKERLGRYRFSCERFGAGITKLGRDRNPFWQNEAKIFSIFQSLTDLNLRHHSDGPHGEVWPHRTPAPWSKSLFRPAVRLQA